MTTLAAVISFIPFKKRWMFCYIAGWIGVTGFFVTTIWALVEMKQYSIDVGGFISLSINFTAWYFLSWICMIAGSLFSHNLYNIEWRIRKVKEIEAYIQESSGNNTRLSEPEPSSHADVL